MSPIRIKAIPIKCGDLQPGDLFSLLGPGFWNLSFDRCPGIGIGVYIRTNLLCPELERDKTIYKLEIRRDHEN